MSAATRSLRHVAFLLAFLATGLVREVEGESVTHSIIWLPTGVAVAGVWLLGLRSIGVVFVAVVLQRLWNGYDPLPAGAAAIGTAAEAMLGVLVLRWCRCHPAFARLRDVVALFAAAAAAPLASVAVSWLVRTTFDIGPRLSGYDGWWRMNALGVLTVVPLVLTWSTGPRARWTSRAAAEGAAVVAAIVALLWAVTTQMPASPTSIVLLYAVLPLLLFAALRFGQRGATATASLAAMIVATVSTHGLGPFVLAAMEERYTPTQIFELTLLAVPLVFGSLIAERGASARLWIRSEGLRAALLNVLPDVVYRIRRDGTVLDALAPDGVTMPTARERLIGQRLAALLPPDVAARLLHGIDEACRVGRSTAIEYRLSAPEQHQVREARFIRLDDDEVLGVVRDITDRANAGRLVAWQARILEHVATAQPIQQVFLEIVHGIEKYVGSGKCSILLLQGRRMHLACAPSLPPDYNAAIEGFEIGPGRGTCGTAAHENRTVVTADIHTDPAWADARELALRHGLRACWSVPIRSPNGKAIGTVAIYHEQPRRPGASDIELVERAAMLVGIAVEREQREDLLGSIQQHVAEGLFRCVPGQGLTYANQRLAELFGYASPQEMLACLAAGAGLPTEHLADIAALGTERGAQHADEVQLHRRDGSRFWALASSTLVRGVDGSSGAYVGVVADITARKQLEEQLRQAQKMEAIGKLAGGVAHDFNNLLTAISGYAEAIGSGLPPGASLRNDVRGILDAVTRAAGLTRQMLAFSRQQVLTPLVVDLARVVDELGDLLRRLLGPRIELRLQRPEAPVPVRVDRSQIEQVILNLVVNARDAMEAGGTLTIGIEVGEAAGTEPAHALLRVRDTGSGMDATARSHAFDPFFTTKAPGKGTGLGLSTVYGIARQSGGDAWIDSEPDRGTTVSIRLPLTAEAPAPEPITVPPPAHAGAATILLVEDEALVRELVQRALVRAGHTVLAANDGQAALATARRHPGTIHLLITDVMMPGLGGRELATRMTAERAGLPVLFVSGYTGDDMALQFATDHRTQLLHKPFAIAALMAAVDDLLNAAVSPDATA
jgi:PAS domain S-box-containing protein